jgi:hypothetical protein
MVSIRRGGELLLVTLDCASTARGARRLLQTAEPAQVPWIAVAD